MSKVLEVIFSITVVLYKILFVITKKVMTIILKLLIEEFKYVKFSSSFTK